MIAFHLRYNLAYFHSLNFAVRHYIVHHGTEVPQLWSIVGTAHYIVSSLSETLTCLDMYFFYGSLKYFQTANVYGTRVESDMNSLFHGIFPSHEPEFESSAGFHPQSVSSRLKFPAVLIMKASI